MHHNTSHLNGRSPVWVPGFSRTNAQVSLLSYVFTKSASCLSYSTGRKLGRSSGKTGEGCRHSICGVSVASLVFDGSIVTNEAAVQQTGSEDIRNIIGDIRYLVTSGATRTTHPLISPYISTCVADISPVSNDPSQGVINGKLGYFN